jgi:hypothetical protein
LFLIWFHRAHRNLASFRLGAFEHSPRGAVFSFFIPFLNLVQPYLVMREIWKASDPTVPPFDQGFWPSARTSPLLGVWWGFFLLRGLLGWGVMFLALNTQGIPALRYSALGSLAMYIVAIPSAAAATILILRVAQRQAILASALPATSPGA